MLPLPEYQTHNHLKFLLNYHFVFIPKRRKKVLLGSIATKSKTRIIRLINKERTRGLKSPRRFPLRAEATEFPASRINFYEHPIAD
jgi:hypothetical protein